MLSLLPLAGAAGWADAGRESVRHWPRLMLGVTAALGAGAAFFPFLRSGPVARAAAWATCSAVAALAPVVVPLEATELRLLVALFSIAVLLKLYDLHAEPGRGRKMGFLPYLAYVPNFFWLVLKRLPPRPPFWNDVRRLAAAAPLGLAALGACVLAFRLDWRPHPFALEHCTKVTTVFLAVVLLAPAAALAIRLVGGPAHDAMNHPPAARTPADFWRRWNRPVFHFLQEHGFKPAGGYRRPVRATLAVFAVSGLCHEYVFGIAAGRVQGWQMLFFMLQGVATVATMRVRPRGAAVPLWVAGTLAFNLAASVIFFRSVAAVVPFYSQR